MATLTIEDAHSGVRLTARGVEPARWSISPVNLASGRPARTGPVDRWLDEAADDVEVGPDWVHLSWERASELSPGALLGLGLPPRAPVVLHIKDSAKTILQAGFRFRFSYRHAANGKRLRVKPNGCFLDFDGRRWTLAGAQYRATQRMELFNGDPPESYEDRLFAWSGIQRDLLGDEAKVGDTHLRGLRIVAPTSFTLRPSLGPTGEVEFAPEVCVRHPSEHPDELAVVRRGLAAATQATFEKHFARQHEIKSSLVAASGTYVVLDPPLQRALSLVREMQQAPPAQRLAFVRSPRTFLREALEDELDPEVLEGLFHDEGYSERVQEVGLWVPKILPWLQSNERREWVPGEPIGLQVGDARLRVHPDRLDALADALEAAALAGQARLEFDGQDWPVSEESLQAIEELRSEVTRRKDGRKRDSDPEADHRLVLIIEDNLEQDAYSASWQSRRQLPKGSPERLKAALYPHQKDALAWLQRHWLSGSPGALLADDMGLGKTIQSLAFLAWLAGHRNSGGVPNRPFLLVAPTGLLVNWEQEADRHLELGALGHVIRAHGPELRSMRVSKHRELKAGLPALDLDRLRTAGWVLTTYETLRDYQHSFGKVRWLAAVFDEVQKIKNPAAAMTHAAKAMQIDFCLSMTGTPVENRLSDVWCLIDRVQPGLLGENKEFVERYERGSEDAPRELSALLTSSPGDGKPPVMLRRIKADHLKGLPEMCVHPMERTMPPSQAAAYANAVALAQASAGEKGAMLRALAELKTLSLHPSLDAFERDEDFIAASARLAATFEVLDGVAARGEKALVFVETLDMQTALLPLLRRRYSLPWLPHVISGRIPGRKRQALVQSFQDRSGFDVMLLSPKAGGVGLTLTAANHVVHLSRWWNPAVEDQCSDRVHRIGQEKTVHVHLPLAVHPELGERSFDLKLDALLESKRGLSRQVLMPALFTKDDAASMFNETVSGPSEAP